MKLKKIKPYKNCYYFKDKTIDYQKRQLHVWFNGDVSFFNWKNNEVNGIFIELLYETKEI